VRQVVLVVIALICLAGRGIAAVQGATTIRVEVSLNRAPLPDAEVIVNGMTYKTGADGIVSIPVAAGTFSITVVKESFAPITSFVTVAAGQTQPVVVELQRQPTLEEEVTVSATRTDKRLADQPMRVEVLGREEIEEKLLMTPGDIVMMLNEMGGMRVQATSPSLGAASVRIQGMRGRYTRVFSDGLPLFGEVGGLGLLQIPPMDLGQVEVIKGVASSMYGAGAMGGIVNLLSRRPGRERERELLVNRSTRGGTDAVAWYATPAASRGWAFTLLGGGHWQDATDVNDDGWADLPGYTRGVVRPRVFWDGGNGRTLFATAGFTAEDRSGGTVSNRVLPATGLAYREALETRRVDAGAVAQVLLNRRYLFSTRVAVMQQRHDHQFGEVRERDRHETVFAETTIRASFNRHTLVAGVAIEHDRYTPTDFPQFTYRFTVPGAFVQDDVDLTSWLSLSASGRVDHHSEYGTFFSPRVGALFRSKKWSSRLSLGTGFFGPSPLTEETEAAGLSRLQMPQRLRAEEGRSASVDVSRTDGPISYTLTIFGSQVKHPIHVGRTMGLVLTNLSEPTTNIGVELLGTIRHEPYSLTATYTFVRSEERTDGIRDDVPLTPRHSAGVVGMWERENVGRVGAEFYYTGTQRLEETPFRDVSKPYIVVGVLAERQFGWARLFINGENLTGVRQTRWDPLIRPTRAPDGRWTVDAWQPLEGRNVNGGVRVRF
jgi:iron complex outermembrane receptor protein